MATRVADQFDDIRAHMERIRRERDTALTGIDVLWWYDESRNVYCYKPMTPEGSSPLSIYIADDDCYPIPLSPELVFYGCENLVLQRRE